MCNVCNVLPHIISSTLNFIFIYHNALFSIYLTVVVKLGAGYTKLYEEKTSLMANLLILNSALGVDRPICTLGVYDHFSQVFKSVKPMAS